MLQKALPVLKKFFGYDNFRPLQKEIIQTVLKKRDSLVLMPTGGGKSLCFQVPALIMEGTTIVVSPLIALMKDQVEALKANGIPAAFLNSSQTGLQQKEIETFLREGKIKLLYVSPEKLLSESFHYLIREINISLFAIDEAHCISAWGHDFRPEYQRLSILKRTFPRIPIVALTATADRIIRKDILVQLQLKTPEVFISSFDRPNIKLSVQPGRNRFQYILNFIKNRENKSGIIYCLSRKSTEQLASKLKKEGINAAHYHAGLSPDERSRVQENFISDKIPIICATIAFGMGIDKSNVRWVIHYNLPKNIESYYQEIGRAGRDGLSAEAVLFYSYADVINLQGFITESGQAEVLQTKLRRMQDFSEAMQCRRKILLSYFGEILEKDCGNCDVCNNPPQSFDGTVVAQKALSAIYRMDQEVGMGMLIDVLRGALTQRIQDKNYHKIKTYGAGKDIKYDDWQQYILQFINLGLIDIAYDQDNILRLTKESEKVLFKGKKIKLVHANIQKEKTKRKTTVAKPETVQDLTLFETLRQLRKRIAEEKKLAPYMVFSDASLTEMASELPANENGFKQIQGVGEKKLELYGEIFINEISNFLKKQDRKAAKEVGGTYMLTYQLYKKGLLPLDIARQRNLSITTIFSHLAKLYTDGKEIELDKYLTDNEFEKIKAAVKITGTEQMKLIFEQLKEEIEYYKIRIALTLMN